MGSGVETEWLLEWDRWKCRPVRDLRVVELPWLQLLRELEIAAAGVGELHLPRRLTFRLEQQGTPDDDAGALRAGGCDVETIEAVKELHAMRGVGGARRRHGIEDYRRLSALEPIDGADPRTRKSRAQIGDLSVVRRDDQDVVEPQGVLPALAISPADVACRQPPDQSRHGLNLLRARALVPVVRDR